MTQPRPAAEPNDKAAADLEAAWTRLAAAQAAALATLDRRHRTAAASALADFAAEAKAFRHAADRAVRDFALRVVPERYEAAARAAAASINRPFSWTPAHRATLQALTADTYTDLSLRVQEAARVAAAFHRAVRAAARRSFTPTSAAQLAAAHPLDRVVYRNGARMPVRAWAEAATLARTAVAYNAGTLSVAREHGIPHVEVTDGADCGWTSHPDPDKAARTVRTVEDAAQWPIAHPRCARAFGLRPDAEVGIGPTPTV
ncbi:hypothetical protein [Kitasatospora cheerisanensis]|uniref:Phage head morphogenesis domain-containing protein n=1 Tax=Kitasatospora cheerisanensis KCTC 2395 TaxID=1348663 RepID=A0A066Z5J0_9ACTN|nr:hypothetical protein [Kitasatospora cheerisanensis]KDN85591.1 hypothetical protein KCH_26080 [Kitasatospora cheerisanensis KCTC 2395]